jgi:hypothetical protein
MFSLEPGSTSTNFPLLPSLNNTATPANVVATTSENSNSSEQEENNGIEMDSLALTTTTTRKFQPRSWKKPYKPLFPSEDSFAEYFPTGATCHTDQIRKFDGPSQEELEEHEREKQKLQNALGLQMQSLYGTTSSSRKKKEKDKHKKKFEEEEEDADEWTKPKNIMKTSKSANALVPLGSPQGSVGSVEDDAILQEVLEKEFQRKMKQQQERQEMAKRRKERKATKRQIGVIPWNLLDDIDGQEKRFESEKSYAEFYHRF